MDTAIGIRSLRLDLSSALSQPPPTPNFIIPGLSRGTVGAIVGPGGTGKTTLATQIAVAQCLGVAAAGDLIAPPASPLRVAFISGEEKPDQFLLRLHTVVDHLMSLALPSINGLDRTEVASALHDRLSIYPCAGYDLNLLHRGKRTSVVDEMLDMIFGHDLVFLETVSRLHDGDENSTAAMAALITTIEHLARAADVAIILLHHSSKAAELNGWGGSQHAARGSSAFVDNARWIANLFKMSEEDATSLPIGAEARERYLKFQITKANYIPPQPARWLRRLAGGVLQAERLGPEPRPGRRLV